MDIKSINQWMTISDNCNKCNKRTFCSEIYQDYCQWGKDLTGYNFSKPGILIIDDNEGICSFIEDDLEELSEDEVINLDDYNVFTFYGKMCAYDFMATVERYPNLNIQKAIIDITYGGAILTDKGNMKLNGVDVFEVLYELNPDVKYLFYTGNQMNTHIKTIGNLMSKYSKITGGKITDNILFKTQFNMIDRRDYLVKKLF